MKAYINGWSCISRENTFEENFFFEGVSQTPTGNNFVSCEPNYKDFVPVNLIRRMSRIVKMGVSCTKKSLQMAGIENVDAIVVGSGIGCYEDTDKFLRSLLENNEEMLTPTAFIQSTHNTVSGQIALLIQCHGYNFTYVHQNWSFESALLDTLMLLNEHPEQNILLGGIDETNGSLLEMFTRAGHIRNENNLSPVWEAQEGYYNGEGASFFAISANQNSHSKAKVEGVKTLNIVKSSDDLSKKIEEFTAELGWKAIDVVLSGNCGDEKFDRILNQYLIEQNSPVVYFKNLCGEHFSSSAFALYLAVEILQKQKLPAASTKENTVSNSIKNIIIVNHYQGNLYSLMAVSAC